MRREIIHLALIAVLVCAGGASAVTWSGNLLENPGAETGDLTAWATDDPVIVVATQIQSESSGDVYPHSGEWFFTMAGAAAAPSGTVASRLLSQDVDVSSHGSQIDVGMVLFDASVFLQTEDVAGLAGADYGQLTLLFMGDSGGEIDRRSTGLVGSSNLTWIEETLDGLVPLGTRSIRFELLGEKHETKYINAFFDTCNLELAVIPEPSTPPVADADGPYTIYVGDTLMLDASGSTDDDNDIVSYVWDLDDNGSFETDAGGQPVFDVNYASLQSLGLLVDHIYNIHLKTTDSEGQSDVADSTLIIVPKPVLFVAVDIKPGSCPNPVNVKSKGVLPVAILGTDDYDVTTIDPTSIRLAGVEPICSSYEDVATPVSDSNDCNCITEGPDGFLDLTLKFKTQRIVEAIGDVNDGDVLELPLTGVLSDETAIEGADCILIKGRHRSRNKADINGDGVVNSIDFAIIAENWLQSSIVDE